MTVSEIINAFGGPTPFGKACGFERHPGARGGDMRQRGSIPPAYWLRLVDEAARQQIEGVIYEALAKAHAAPTPEPAR